MGIRLLSSFVFGFDFSSGNDDIKLCSFTMNTYTLNFNAVFMFKEEAKDKRYNPIVNRAIQCQNILIEFRSN